VSNWVEKLMDGAFDDPAGRLVEVSCDELEVGGDVVGRVVLSFTVEDVRGETYEAKGRLLLPRTLADEPGGLLPAVLHCGYEAPEPYGARQVARGRVSATTVQLPLDAVFPNSWALLRGPKMEFVLGHLVRGLSFVDPARVAYAGGSAGGYSAILAAAEAFPAAAAVPGVPPTNLAYMGAWTATNLERLAGTDAPSLGWLEGMSPAVAAWRLVYGDDYDAPSWLAHSPVSHVDEVTCPVATFFSMSDVLVPIAQVDEQLGSAVVQTRPGQLEFRPEELSDAAAVRVRLLDVLGERADVQVVPVPEHLEPMLDADLAMVTEMPPFELPDLEPVAGRWAVTVADEGEPIFLVSHYKHQYEPDFEPFMTRALAVTTEVDQLTERKLEQLLARWTGEEWFAPGFGYLDRPEAERADVERGLRAYCATSQAHAARFSELYGRLPDSRRVLPTALVGSLLEAASSGGR
jgi:hypothetical protein